jgi:aerobic-type carbon monoxide dehydrogenase small subunit (CoxS/CutS family)
VTACSRYYCSCQEVILIALSVNAKRVMVDVDPSTPLLWVLRDNLGLTGTKYAYGMAQWGHAPFILMVRRCALVWLLFREPQAGR